MKIKELGVLDDPVLLYGGPYSNLHATKALFAEADAMGIPPQRRICTGDAVAYGANPVETAQLVLAEGGTLVAGNCEHQLGAGAESCGCGFEDGSTCDILSKGWYPFALRALIDRPDIADAFRAAPDIAIFHHHGRRCAVIHGGVSDVARFLWFVSPDEHLEEEIQLIEQAAGPIDVVVAGHSGLPFVRPVAGRQWINAGAVGLPANDGTPDVQYAILADGVAHVQRMTYDAEGSKNAMISRSLTQGYELTMTSGHWPSEDILPMALRRASTGA